MWWRFSPTSIVESHNKTFFAVLCCVVPRAAWHSPAQDLSRPQFPVFLSHSCPPLPDFWLLLPTPRMCMLPSRLNPHFVCPILPTSASGSFFLLNCWWYIYSAFSLVFYPPYFSVPLQTTWICSSCFSLHISPPFISYKVIMHKHPCCTFLILSFSLSPWNKILAP